MSVVQVYNNFKISKIYSIQRQKELINANVDELKDKIKRWRMFTKTTLTTDSKKTLKTSKEDKEEQLNKSLLGSGEREGEEA
jgi:hypothetical protein